MMRRALPLAVYAGAAVVFTWPLILHPASRLGASALQPSGDPYLNLWALGWDLQTISTHPAALFDGRIFNANIFHPAELTLAYSDHLLLQALAIWPLYAVSGNLVLCYNALLLVSLIANALAMHLFARSVTASEAGAYAAGLAWGFWPYHFAHLLHLQLQALYFLPLAFLFLHRVVAARRRADAIALGLCAGMQTIASIYYGVIGAVGLICGAVALATSAGCSRKKAVAGRLLLAILVGAVVSAPFVWPYWKVQRTAGFARNLYEASHSSADPGSYLRAPQVNLVYGTTGLLDPVADKLDSAGEIRRGWENQLFPGFVLLLLAAVGLWGARRAGAWPLALSMTVVAGAGFLLSFGPEGIRPLYATLHRFIFGFHAIRAPARFAVLTTFGLAALAALGLRELTRMGKWESSGRPVLPVAVIALLGLEYLNIPIPYISAPPQRTALGQWLRAAEPQGPIIYLPLALDAENTPFMVQSLEHGRPIVNGYSGQRPPFFTALAETLARFPSAEAIWALHELGVSFIITAKPVAGNEWPVVERARLPDELKVWNRPAIVYELRWSPEIEGRLPAPEAPPPPEPGPVPFERGETAVYRVSWGGAGAGLPAGQATMSVGAPEGADSSKQSAYRFIVSAETAAWVSRFFEARDRFESLANDRLLPLRYTQQLREGRRQVDQTVIYDHVRRTVQLASAGTSRTGAGLTLRIAPGTRDPISTFFYARTLPLKPGDRLCLPVNNIGRSFLIDLRSVGVETIEYNGQRAKALRLDPRIMQQIVRRSLPEITLWLSLDERRIPLVLEVSAGFGNVRAELTSYRPR